MQSHPDNDVVLDAFHPLVAGWFRERFGAPTDPQRAGWPRIGAREDVLIAAPTGSGKTLAAFLACLDALVRRGLERPLPDHTSILYLSPLKALSNDVQRNLEAPLAELTAYAARQGIAFPEIRVAVRTGDTSASERAKLSKKPAHILVTTPESLYILLTSVKGRASLGQLDTVIVDEIHAIAGDKRGAHLAISLERLDRLVGQLTGTRPTRVGLSATQRPIERIARLLVGTKRELPHIVDGGHRRDLDLAIEITDDELGAVASNEQFDRVYDRIAELVGQHRSTIVFVNTRRLVERAAAALEQRLGEEHVVAHHGSMSRALRLAAEQKLKLGLVKCAVATASLELGIDVGAVDLVVQLGSPRSIATLLQRVGRSGHHLGGTPKGRMFALTRDQLVECSALVRGVRRGNLDEIAIRDAPLDILSQQIVATAAAEEIPEVELLEMLRSATPYSTLTTERFDQILEMLSEGVSDRRGRLGAHIHRDRVAGVVRGRRGARLAAITCGGAIPDNNNYAVVQWPEETRVGEVDEDFAIDSSAGDIFQLGNTAWKIRRIENGRVLVEDAKGMPPTIPFWFGEAPARTRELSDEVSELRGEIDRRLGAGEGVDAIAEWLAAEASLPSRAAQQLVAYLAAGRAALGALPRKDLLVAERFFDEGGGMQLVIHAPLGGRINRAWGLALRKKFCRTFDFELQAAATDDGIVISLGQPHSFALETVFGFVPSKQAEHTLVQALLDRPMFEIRWRWNITRSLTVLRRRGGKKVPPHLVKMRAADTLSVVFPHAQACPENLGGEREIPDHPLVFETIRDCLVEAMDLEGLTKLIEQLEGGAIQIVARDTVEPSPLSHELINANPYAFLDDAPLEERRTRAVTLRRGLPASIANGGSDAVGTLDGAAIASATDEVAPLVRDTDELHDALLALYLVPESHGQRLAPGARDWFENLTRTGRATRMRWEIAPTPGVVDEARVRVAWVATERLGAVRSILGDGVECEPAIPTPSWSQKLEREDAMRKLVGSHLDHRGPVTSYGLADELGLPATDVLMALLALEADGAILRGSFTAAAPVNAATLPAGTTSREALLAADDTALLYRIEWCNRRVLARIHRLTLAKLRKEIEPVSAAALMRFLLRWQRVSRHTQLIGVDGLARVIEQLQGFETAAGAWEREILPTRLHGYDPSWLDQMCLAGQIVWCRLSPRKPANDIEDDVPEPVEVVETRGRKAKRDPKRSRARGADPKRTFLGLFASPATTPSRADSDPYDLAEAGAEAARIGGASRDEIAAAAARAIEGRVPPPKAQMIASLVTASAMLRRGECANDVDASDCLEPLDRNADDDLDAALAATAGDDLDAEARAVLAPTADFDLDAEARAALAATAGDDLDAEARAALAAAADFDLDVETRAAFAAFVEQERRALEAEARTAAITERRARRAPLPPTAEQRARRDALAAAPSGDASDEANTSRSDKWAAARSRVEQRNLARGSGVIDPRPRPNESHGFGSAANTSSPRTNEPAGSGSAQAFEANVDLRGTFDAATGSAQAFEANADPRGTFDAATKQRATRSAPSRSAPLAFMLRRDVAWLRAATAIAQHEPAVLTAQAERVRDYLARTGASFLTDLVASVDLPPDEIEDALWELVGAGLATADGFASLRVLVDRKRGEVKSHFDRHLERTNGLVVATQGPPVRKWQDAIKKARHRDRERPGHALRSLPTAAGRWSLLPPASTDQLDPEASARQLLLRYGVVFRDLIARESSLPPWRDMLVVLRRLEARGEIRGGRFVNGFVGEQFALPEALDELRAVRHPGHAPDVCRIAATDPLNLVGILSAGPRVPAIVGNAVLYVDGHPVASLEGGEIVPRTPLPPGARIDEDLTYHPPPRPVSIPSQPSLPW